METKKYNWLEMEPDIRNGLMITGHYSSSRDDTEYYDVYAYPSLVYLFRYNSSRFNNTGHIHEHYPKHDEYGFLPVGELKIWRDLYPCLNQNGYYLERICWGHPECITHNGTQALDWSYTITNYPRPFEEIVKEKITLYKQK